MKSRIKINTETANSTSFEIIRLSPVPESKNILMFRSSLNNLKELFSLIDRGEVAIGEENLSLRIAMEIGEILRHLSKPDVRNSAHIS